MELRGSLFRFFGNLVFVQHYSGFACFYRFRVVPGRPKINKKTCREKSTSQTHVFEQKLPKSAQKGTTFSPLFALLFRTFCALGAQGCPKAPRDRPGTPKVLKKVPKRSPKATKMEPKVLENATKNTKHNSR
mgnify:CR=1 FL=1